MPGVTAHVALDALLLALCALGFFPSAPSRRALLFPPVCAAACVVGRWFSSGLPESDLLLLPVGRPVALFFFLVPLLLLNGLWFSAGEGHVFFGTAAQMGLYLLLREICVAGLGVLGLREGFWELFAPRILSLLLWAALLVPVRWMGRQLEEGNPTAQAVVCTTFLILLVPWCLGLYGTTRAGWGTVAALLALLAAVDGCVLYREHRREQAMERIRLQEQYLPMVEELVESVRARQHDYNNRLMALAASVETAETLEEAKKAVADLTGSAGLDPVSRQLLRCDSRVISGMLFGKIRQARQRHVTVDASLSGAFLRRSLPEAEWVELAGILLDNALEACAPDDTIWLQSREEEDGLRFTVSNPCAPMSAAELAQMFRRGYSTKGQRGRGYGLFNLRRMVERRGGTLVVGNEERDGRNCLTVGAVIP